MLNHWKISQAGSKQGSRGCRHHELVSAVLARGTAEHTQASKLGHVDATQRKTHRQCCTPRAEVEKRLQMHENQTVDSSSCGPVVGFQYPWASGVYLLYLVCLKKQPRSVTIKSSRACCWFILHHLRSAAPFLLRPLRFLY